MLLAKKACHLIKNEIRSPGMGGGGGRRYEERCSRLGKSVATGCRTQYGSDKLSKLEATVGKGLEMAQEGLMWGDGGGVDAVKGSEAFFKVL